MMADDQNFSGNELEEGDSEEEIAVTVAMPKKYNFSWVASSFVLGSIVGGSLWMILGFFTSLGSGITGLMVTPLILGGAAWFLSTLFYFARAKHHNEGKDDRQRLINAIQNGTYIAFKTLISTTFWTLGATVIAPGIFDLLSISHHATSALGIAAKSIIIGISEGSSLFVADLIIVKWLSQHVIPEFFKRRENPEAKQLHYVWGFDWKKEAKDSAFFASIATVAAAFWNVFATPEVNIFNNAGETTSNIIRIISNTMSINIIFITPYVLWPEFRNNLWPKIKDFFEPEKELKPVISGLEEEKVLVPNVPALTVVLAQPPPPAQLPPPPEQPAPPPEQPAPPPEQPPPPPVQSPLPPPEQSPLPKNESNMIHSLGNTLQQLASPPSPPLQKNEVPDSNANHTPPHP